MGEVPCRETPAEGWGNSGEVLSWGPRAGAGWRLSKQHIAIRTCTWAGWDGCGCQLPFGFTRCCHNVNSGQEKALFIRCEVQSCPGLGRLPCSDTAGLCYLYLHTVQTLLTPLTPAGKREGPNAAITPRNESKRVLRILAHCICSVRKLKE